MADECDLDELTAFLEASDSELDELVDNIDGDKPTDNKTASITEVNEEEKRHFTDVLEADNHDNSYENHSTGDILDKTEDKSESISPVTSKLESPSSVVDKSNVVDDKIDKSPAIDADSIKAEMQAMAERMKQLEQLLNQSQSNTVVSSPKVENKEKRMSNSPNEKTTQDSKHSSNHKEDNKKSVKNSSSSVKNSSPSVKSSSPSVKSSSPSVKRTSPSVKRTSPNTKSTSSYDSSAHKSKLSLNDKTLESISKNTSTMKTFSKNPACDKLTLKSDGKSSSTQSLHRKHDDRLNTKKSPTLKSTTKDDDDDNPFFTDNKSTPVSDMVPDSTVDNDIVNTRSIFGDSDDSDWEDLAGEEKHELSKEGKDLKKLIVQGQKKRQAHTANYDTNILKKPDLTKWSDKIRPPIKIHSITGTTGSRMNQSTQPATNPETGTVSGKYKLKDEYMVKSNIVKEDERETVTDPFCGIRIINPRISMSDFKLKMDGRSMIKIPKLLSKYNKSDLQKDNFVVIGVVVSKSEPRQSAGGKTYCIWKLNDLQDCDKTITFFLFGNVYKEHWKNDLGVVIGLLNPSFMDKAEKSQSEVAMTIQHPQQLLMLGISKDLGRCRSTTKSGQPCSNFINKQQGEFCSYHVQQAYRKSSSKRTELQASTGVQPKAFNAKKTNSQKDGFFFYGGNTYTTMRPQGKSKDTVTLKKLQRFDASKPQGRITTMTLHELEPEDKKKIDKLAEKDKQLLSMLSVPSAGSMNFVKHLVKKDATKSFVKTGDGDDDIKGKVSARDLLKEHTQLIVQKKRETALLSSTPTIGKGLTAGQHISLDVPIKKKPSNASAEFAKQLAIAKIKAKGGLTKEDPNNVCKKLLSPEAKEKIRKRVAEEIDLESSPSQDRESREPPRKKSKFLGDLDLNSPEVQKLLKKKSKHTGALAEAESEHEDRYFSALEKREKMEEKMDSITEVEVKLVYCVQCKYKYFSAHERCKKENHVLKYIKGVKRFYKCKNCKKRIVCLEKFPTSPCEQCGNTNYQRVSMLQEKKGPKLESEELCLRGNEQKFIGSLQGKASFNG